MKENPKDENFISKLLKETMMEFSQEKEEGHQADFHRYFENMSENFGKKVEAGVEQEIPVNPISSSLVAYLKQQGIFHLEGEYVAENQCFRFHLEGRVLDFPRNWSFFKELYNAIEDHAGNSHFIFSHGEDGEHLLKILPFPAPGLIHLVFFTENRILILAGIQRGEEARVEEFLTQLFSRTRPAPSEQKKSDLPEEKEGPDPSLADWAS